MDSNDRSLHYYDCPPYFFASPGKLGPRYCPSSHYNQEADCACLETVCIRDFVKSAKVFLTYQECAPTLEAMHKKRKEHRVHQAPNGGTEVDQILRAVIIDASLLKDARHKVSLVTEDIISVA